MAEIKPNVNIVPLYEDLTKIVGTEFFVSTAFKRWLVKVGLAEIWNQCYKMVRRLSLSLLLLPLQVCLPIRGRVALYMVRE